LKILRELGDKYKQKLWGWLWAEGAAQLEVESALELGFGYPGMNLIYLNDN
jgi:protein disulfide-isomerase A6